MKGISEQRVFWIMGSLFALIAIASMALLLPACGYVSSSIPSTFVQTGVGMMSIVENTTTSGTNTISKSATSSASFTSPSDIQTTISLPLIDAQPPANAVWIFDIGLNPEFITVQSGTTVTWTDLGELPYTIMSDDGVFLSPELVLGSSWSFTFVQSGIYSYHVSEDMDGLIGEVIVE